MENSINIEKAKIIATSENENAILENSIAIDDIIFTIKQNGSTGKYYGRIGNSITITKEYDNVTKVIEELEHPNWMSVHIIAANVAHYVIEDYINNKKIKENEN